MKKNLTVIILFSLFLIFSYLIYVLDKCNFTMVSEKQKIEEQPVKIQEKIIEKVEVTKPKLNLKKVSFNDLDDFKKDDFSKAYPALIKSCDKILPTPMDRIVKKIFFDQSCKALKKIKKVTDKSVREVIIKYFEPYLVKDENNNSEGTFTGYYSIRLNGSYKKSDIYKYPLYKLPKDVVTIDFSNFMNCTKCTFVGRLDKNKNLVPYFSNEDIKNGKVSENEVLLWVDNPVNATIMHIQGSGVVILPDGDEIKINYAGNNGHGFVGIGWILKNLNLLADGKGSMQDVRQWLLDNPEKAEDLMAVNPRYIFFKKAINNIGPIGSLGVELTAGRSIAIDNDYIPLGVFVWVDTTSPDGKKLRKLVSAQDTGAAIKGMVRADYYFGVGEKAFSDAGRMKSKGSYYLILPKEQLF